MSSACQKIASATAQDNTTCTACSITEIPSRDIILVKPSRTAPSVAGRPANRFLFEILKPNVVLFRNLPREQQESFVDNIYHFVTTVLLRQFWDRTSVNDDAVIGGECRSSQYHVLPEEVCRLRLQGVLKEDRTMEAANLAYPLWLMGIRPGTNYVRRRRGMQGESSWSTLPCNQANDVLCANHGFADILLLPRHVDLSSLGEAGRLIMATDDPTINQADGDKGSAVRSLNHDF